MNSDWTNCERCGLSGLRHMVVRSIGPTPARVLLIGEAPGKVEDIFGEPFVGPSGRLLRQAIGAEVVKLVHITNLLGCRPCDTAGGPNRKPTREEVWACWPRLEEIHRQVQPEQVICLGEEAFKYCKAAFGGVMKIYHPAFILRGGGTGSAYYPEWKQLLREVLNV